MPGDSLAVRKSCLLFIFTPHHSPTLGHSHPCYTSKNLYRLHLLLFPCLYSSSCTDSSFILAGQLLSAPYPCLPLVRLALTPGTLLHCSPLLLRGPYIFTKRSRPAREGEKRKNGREEPRNNRLRCIFLHNNTTSSSLPALYYSSSLFRVIHSTPTSSVLLRPLRCPPQ